MATFSDNTGIKQEIITIDQDNDDHQGLETEEEDVSQFFHFDGDQREDEDDGSNFTVADWAGEMTQQEVKNELMLDRLIEGPNILQFNEDGYHNNFSTRRNEQQQQQQQEQHDDGGELIVPDITGCDNDYNNLIDESEPSTSSLLSSNLKKVQRNKSKIIKLNKSIYRNRISRRGTNVCPSSGRGCGARIKVLTEKVLKLEIKYLKARIKSLNDRVRWKDDEITRLKSADNRCTTCNSSTSSQSIVDQQQKQQQSHQQQSPQPILQQQQSLESSEKIKIIQQQISLFLHALQCQRSDEQCCTMTHCRSAKQVLGHIQSCQLGRNCAIKHCFSSRQILGHFKYCQRADCVLCLPFRQDSVRLSPILNNYYRTASPAAAAATGNSDHHHQLSRQNSVLNNHHNFYNNSTTTSPALRHSVSSSSSSSSSTISSYHHHHNRFGSNSTDEDDVSILFDKGQMTTTTTSATTTTTSDNSDQSQSLPTTPLTTIKTWQQLLNPNVRKQVVHRYVKAIFPDSSPPQVLLDRRVSNVVAYCKSVELRIFGSSNSEAEYLSLMAKEIRKTEQELVRKSQLRKKTRQQPQSQQQQQLLQ